MHSEIQFLHLLLQFFFRCYFFNSTAYEIYIFVLPNAILVSWSLFEAVRFHFTMNFTLERLSVIEDIEIQIHLLYSPHVTVLTYRCFQKWLLSIHRYYAGVGGLENIGLVAEACSMSNVHADVVTLRIHFLSRICARATTYYTDAIHFRHKMVLFRKISGLHSRVLCTWGTVMFSVYQT
jgi:hypothetical protein